MDLQSKRVFLAGATGALGGALTEALLERGARVVPGGRDPGRLAELGEACGTTPVSFDVVDAESTAAAVKGAANQLGGFDIVVVAVGIAGFGPALQADAAVAEELFAVNALGPMQLIRSAAPHLEPGGTVAVLSAILADLPTNQMAEYSAAKSALSAWLGVLRREARRSFSVLDVRPPHLDTGLETRALGSEPPTLPAAMPAAKVVAAILEALTSGAREITYDAQARALRLA